MSAINKIGPDHYRYFATLDESGVTVRCERFTVIGETERCYYVIRSDYAHLAEIDWSKADPWRKKLRKRVLKDSSGRRYCYPCKMHALQSFRQRQRWRISHAERSLAVAELSLSVVDLAIENLALIAPQDSYKAGQNSYTESLHWADC